MKTWWLAVAAAAVVVAAALAVAVALPGDLVIPNGPTSSPAPSMTTTNFLDPAFGWRSAIIVTTAVFSMTAIALIARARERRRRET